MTAYATARCCFLFTLISLTTACTSVTQKIDQVDEQTAQQTTDVKAALIDSTDVDAAAIQVSLGDDGSLLLSGFVESEAERQAALKIARDAMQGGEVIDELEVR